MSFKELGLSSKLDQQTSTLGYTTPFPIQEQVIPPFLAGKDITGIAPTGSGKTASFALPILEKLQHQTANKSRNIPVLILVPTRELANQIHQTFKDNLPALERQVKTMAVFGGISINPQMKNMLGVEVLIATPGRLIDLIEHKALSLEAIQTLVVDEADKMFQMGFDKEMKQVLAWMPKKKQIALFSATLNEQVKTLIDQLKIDPVQVEIAREESEVVEGSITEYAYLLENEKKGPFLRYLIKSKEMQKVLVFVSAVRTAENVKEKLKKNGITADTIHSGKTQGGRFDALDKFERGHIRVLITTDLMARGIHIGGLDYVINYELPRSPLDYVHRIGRTGRAHASGEAHTLVTPEDTHHFKIILKKSKKFIPLIDIDEMEGVKLFNH